METEEGEGGEGGGGREDVARRELLGPGFLTSNFWGSSMRRPPASPPVVELMNTAWQQQKLCEQGTLRGERRRVLPRALLQRQRG